MVELPAKLAQSSGRRMTVATLGEALALGMQVEARCGKGPAPMTACATRVAVIICVDPQQNPQRATGRTQLSCIKPLCEERSHYRGGADDLVPSAHVFSTFASSGSPFRHRSFLIIKCNGRLDIVRRAPFQVPSEKIHREIFQATGVNMSYCAA